MAVDADEAYTRGLDFFTEAVAAVPADGWGNPSPCAQWRALDLLGHVGGIVRFGTEMLRGRQPAPPAADPPGDLVEGDPAQWWAASVEPARSSLSGVDLDQVLDSPRGRLSVREGFSFPAVDLFVHGWDLARSAGRGVQIPDDIIAFAYALAEPMPEDALRSPGVFGPEVQPPAGAAPTQRLVAWMGRDPSWAPPSREA